MAKRGEAVLMIHYACRTCSMTATCVSNVVATLAWLDHMQSHALIDNYDAYTWMVEPLPFGE